MNIPKTRIAKYIYYRKKANSFENKYLKELEKNEPLKIKLLEVQEELLNLYQKRTENSKEIKDLKKRISDLEIVNNKKGR